MALLEVKNLHTYFKTRKGIVKAVNDVSYSLDSGKTIGIVGESGSGKSVSAMSILQLLDGNGYIAEGEVIFEGKDLTKLSQQEMYSIRGNKISVIFQEPMTSLNPVFTVKRQLSEPFIIHQKMSKKEAEKKAVEMLYAVQIPNPETVLLQYPHQLSGGMRQRVMIAMALACRPDLLICDEPTTALDVTVQAQILRLILQMQQRMGMSVLLITHDMGVVSEMADEVIVIYAGKIVEKCGSQAIFEKQYHPYTEALIHSIPVIGTEQTTLATIPGMVPRLTGEHQGCLFADRCGFCREVCRRIEPSLQTVEPGRQAACLRYTEHWKEAR